MKNLITTLAIGISKAQMYSPEHEAVISSAIKLCSLFEEVPDDDINVMVVGNELVINGVLNREPGLHGEKLIRMLGAKGISRVDFLKNVTPDEVAAFMGDAADSDKELGSYSRIRPGVLKVRLSSALPPSDLDLGAFSEEQLGKLQSVYGSISPFRELEIASIEEIVAGFLLTFRRGANILRMISPVRSHSEYTYTHAMNVAVLSISMAEALGLSEESVLEVGIGALMHDVGKLFVTKSLLHKKGRLTAKEFDHIKQHALLGTAYLAKIEEMPRLAPIIALEHHLRFDGKGYPVLRRTGGRQHLASQIVAIADCFDALRSTRPYRRSLSAEEVLSLLKEGSGTSFNPDLFSTFTVIIGSAL
jgi:putative nucleotidyltransferase with HDIG domain